MTSADAAPDSTDARQRLADQVRSRRLQLGLSVRAAAEQAGIARGTWIGLEDASRRTAETSYAGIERILQWAPGSVSGVLGGEQPADALVDPSSTPDSMLAAGAGHLTSTAAADDIIIEIMRREDLTERQKARIIRTLIAEQERFARERAGELIRDALQGGD
ncbi:hypothetical protein ACIA5D_17880 [Actinoplanes sp. NPDC051513]|uniref:hypothetical protein n=1 Tax=Actinoplanes sp. NPDC051513 TaxID=3363908 RepID=UPI0037973CBC